MCLIGLALDVHPRWRRVLVGNRDEYHNRPSAALAHWHDEPGVYGGRDLVAGGSWLALRGQRLAAVTNVRRMMASPIGAPSRGWLVRDHVLAQDDTEVALDHLAAKAQAYAGFNLLAGDEHGMWFASNRQHWLRQRLGSGIHVVANASLDTPWRKSERLRAALSAWCRSAGSDPQPLFQALSDETPADDDELPDTGFALETERLLSPVFIRGERYGTRASTIVLNGDDGSWLMWERRYAACGEGSGESHLQLPATTDPERQIG